MLEGDPTNPLDFHSLQNSRRRVEDCAKIAEFLEQKHGMNMSFFANVFRGTQDPWEKLKINDVNKQMMQFQHPQQQNQNVTIVT
jgi:5-methylcytosine-specific restriction endonuclease McrBC GTP-binding regulatory subunit McrB